MSEHTYDLDYASNSYFQGSDGLITRDDDKTIRINVKDGMMAVQVKDHALPDSKLSSEYKQMLEKLEQVKGPMEHPYPGATYTEFLYDALQVDWWHDAEFMAQDKGYKTVWSSGRSGGWCCIDGTQNLVEDFPLPPDEDALRFLDLAFELVENIDYFKSDEVFGHMIADNYWGYVHEVREREHWAARDVMTID